MDEILIILKALTNTTESDVSLNKLIITAAAILQREITFDIIYEVNITAGTITPDPEDNAYILLNAYKAAILLLQSEIRTYSHQSIKIVDGPSTIDLSGRSKDLRSILDSLINDFNNIKRDYLFNSGNMGYAIITPTTVEYIRGNNFS